MKIIGNEVQAFVAADQLCARQKAGCETAVHTMSDLFGSHVEGVLFVDAKNAFNNINRSVFLHNIRTLCPHLQPALKIITAVSQNSLWTVKRSSLAKEPHKGIRYQWQFMLWPRFL